MRVLLTSAFSPRNWGRRTSLSAALNSPLPPAPGAATKPCLRSSCFAVCSDRSSTVFIRESRRCSENSTALSSIKRRHRQPGAGKQLEVGDDVLPGGGGHHGLFRGIVGIRPSHGHEIDYHPIGISVQAFPDFPGDGLRVRLSFGGGVVDAEDLELVVRHACDDVLAAERMLRPDAVHDLFQPARLSQYFVPGASDVHGGSGAEG